MSAPTGYEWPTIPDPNDLGTRLRAAEAETSRLRRGMDELCTEAEARTDKPNGGLVSARRLRRLLAGEPA